MLKTPMQQLVVATTLPAIISSGVILMNMKAIKKILEKARSKKPGSLLAKAYVPLSVVSYAAAGYASFRVYLRSTLLGPPISNTPKTVVSNANKMLMAYATSLVSSAAWAITLSTTHATTNLLCGVTYLSSTLLTLRKTYLVDKVASRFMVPLTVFCSLSALFTLHHYASETSPTDSNLRKKISSTIKKIHCSMSCKCSKASCVADKELDDLKSSANELAQSAASKPQKMTDNISKS